ncbi:ABC transporter ATP-binding protein [Eubacterium barkeri]|uniref:ABC-type multidrug transport system, ATPase and permease component n=1 Tax=Eubacterium barkeri TaxID=1528 RepID=A0A1H3HJW5_EUBBA|nr:ABC transporter ATP-binding protein [Eubacterium barkeri]SDY15650.1 ABC-type multidrug transport system, ATPase and permease component [Eubacterium barkeri]
MDKAALGWIGDQWRGHKRWMVLLIVGNGVIALTALAFALGCRWVIDSAVAGNQGRFYGAGGCLLGIITLYLCLRLGCNILDEVLRARLGVVLRQRLLHCFYLKTYPSLSTFHSGELLNRLFSDVTVVVDGSVGILPTLVNLSLRILGAIGLLLWMKQWVLLIFLFGGMGAISALTFLRRRFKALHQHAQQAEGEMRSFFQEALENRLMVKCFGVEATMEGEAADVQRLFLKKHLKRRGLSVASSSAMDVLFNYSYCFALLIGGAGMLWTPGGMSYGTLMAMLQLVGQIQNPFAGLSGLLPRQFAMVASAERLMALYALPDEEKKTHLDKPVDFDTIALEKVCFGYDPETPVLRAIDLTIRMGERIALQGASGGGKTTLFLLLMGIYAPDNGRIWIECGDHFRTGGPWTRQLFAWVPQGHFLMSGTLRENLRLLNEEATDDQLWEFLDIACAGDFVRQLPQGLDTGVGERGVGLSEGQIQRIAIARAVASPAPILLLDESTSALDVDTEAAVLHNLEALHRTCIIVTHRPSALRICNRYFVLKQGRLVENGLGE